MYISIQHINYQAFCSCIAQNMLKPNNMPTFTLGLTSRYVVPCVVVAAHLAGNANLSKKGWFPFFIDLYITLCEVSHLIPCFLSSL